MAIAILNLVSKNRMLWTGDLNEDPDGPWVEGLYFNEIWSTPNIESHVVVRHIDNGKYWISPDNYHATKKNDIGPYETLAEAIFKAEILHKLGVLNG